MPVTLAETQETLKTLERLIAVAEFVGLTEPAQCAALEALRCRRTTLRGQISARQALRRKRVVPLAAWRDAVGARRAGL